MPHCLFVTDIHGSTTRYEKLFRIIAEERPAAVFIGGDLLPHAMHHTTAGEEDFTTGYLAGRLREVKQQLKHIYPRVFVIMGNDDVRSEEQAFLDLEREGLWEYVHDRWSNLDEYGVYGYAFVPPTPFQLKDWDRYDVSRYVDPGCISPEEGRRSVPAEAQKIRHETIKKDLAGVVPPEGFATAILLFHTPPHKTNLDRAALDGRTVDHVPLDVHVGSIAVRQFIEEKQPLVTLHGHIHESARITGKWQDKIGGTYAFSAAHDGPELAVVKFDPANPQAAVRELL